MDNRKSLLAVALILFFLACMTLAPGCGGKRVKGGESPGVAEEELAEETAEAAEGEALPGTSLDEGVTAEGTRRPSGYGFDPQEIGHKEPLEYLQLVDVRWSDHGDYFRLVAELKKLDGSDVENVPWCRAEILEDPTDLPGRNTMLFIRGIHAADIHVASLRPGIGTLTGDPMCFQVSLTTTFSYDGVDGATLHVSKNDKRPHRLSYATSPMRIILDIQK
ncbi:MAG: hypothetical protein H5T73_04900 [Actinobacteria bacterium]|nr:hypothetical protein [Actinomycetota bacterium]